jgi:hypothetical protein
MLNTAPLTIGIRFANCAAAAMRLNPFQTFLMRGIPMDSHHKTVVCWIMIGLTLIAGCVPSLNPVYTDETLTFEPALVGVWKQPATRARWNFSQLDEKSYRLEYTDEKGQHGRFIGRLAKLDGELFLDLYPEEITTEGNGFYDFHLIPIHTIYRVRVAEGGLKLAAIDFLWLDDHLTKNPAEIQYATFNNRKLITAPTAEVQKFVLTHKDRFTGDFELQTIESSN